jgi:hypothetical protein
MSTHRATIASPASKPVAGIVRNPADWAGCRRASLIRHVPTATTFEVVLDPAACLEQATFRV